MGKHSIILAAGLVVAAATSLPLGLGQPVLAADTPHYVITDLGTLGGSFSDSLDVSDRGEVTGVTVTAGDTALRGFVWKNGRITDVGTLGGPQSGVGGINSAGQVAAWMDLTVPAPPSIFNHDSVFCNPPMVAGEPTVACRAVLWDHGKKIDLGTLGGLNSSVANKGINEHGHVVGVAETATVDPTSPYGAPVFHAFLWRHGRMLDLGTSGRGSDSVASAVNDRDQAAGADLAGNTPFQHSFAWFWQDGKKTALGTLGGSFTGASAINDRGQVVGASYLVGDTLQHAFLWQDGRMTDLGMLPGDVQSFAADITDQGTILGVSCSSDGCRPVLWRAGQIVDLTAAIPASSGWQLFDVQAINARGQIVGGGLHNGEFRAFLMTPVH